MRPALPARKSRVDGIHFGIDKGEQSWRERRSRPVFETLEKPNVAGNK